jgi:hypothetical protein
MFHQRQPRWTSHQPHLQVEWCHLLWVPDILHDQPWAQFDQCMLLNIFFILIFSFEFLFYLECGRSDIFVNIFLFRKLSATQNLLIYLSLCCCRYNPAVPGPPNAWGVVPPRPQPWFPQPPTVSIPPPVQYPQQPLFPVQNVRPPLPSTTSPALQSQITPPGLPSSTPPVPVSQPLFPVVGNNHMATQSSPFSAAPMSSSVPSIAPGLSSNVPIDAHLGINSSVTSSYQAIGIPGNALFSFLEPL